MNIVCGAIGFIVAYAAFTQAKAAATAGNKNKARLYMLVSALAGAYTVLNILSVIF